MVDCLFPPWGGGSCFLKPPKGLEHRWELVHGRISLMLRLDISEFLCVPLSLSLIFFCGSLILFTSFSFHVLFIGALVGASNEGCSSLMYFLSKVGLDS